MGTLGSISIGARGHWGKIWALEENEREEKLVPGQTGRLFAANEQGGCGKWSGGVRSEG